MTWWWILPIANIVALVLILAVLAGAWLYERDLLAEMKRSKPKRRKA